MDFIMFLYYVMSAIIAIVFFWNYFKTKDKQKQILIAIALLPFLLRLLRWK
ncbi:MAG TPA: hypothetical protein PLB79_07085 [Thermotogota bacterium]|mgnify:CR=1|jgi:hypothetical protein|nr:hypothetical protein [Thermotogota bacterium]NLH18829.1 hypothetical protein [Thermotogaceae bacterium]OQC31526.1 MAG: hypothetical protein BWX67_01052 [Thermotogota bacterium ADurb.Bin062]HNW46496.1 hypothetical protein [Thermotogota bacterium]HNY82000.1 hypothetical protein [Thermotogota bacterium]